MGIGKNNVIVSKQLLESAIKVLDYEEDRGFKCFNNEDRIVSQIKSLINNNMDNNLDCIFTNSMDLDFNEDIICDLEIIISLRDILKERYGEYKKLISVSTDFWSKNKRTLVDTKNKRDKFGLFTDFSDIIDRHNEKYKNFEKLIKKIENSKEVYLEIEHSSKNVSETNKIIIKISTNIIVIKSDRLIIGKPLDEISVNQGIYFDLNTYDIVSIKETFLNKGYKLFFHKDNPISILFDK
ncbi:MAG: hypothetical protein FH761_08445 [Firmicutes bacterium]|nr:hypothetical protein [Bacillota bacterium]